MRGVGGGGGLPGLPGPPPPPPPPPPPRRASQALPLNLFTDVSLTNKIDLNSYDDDLFCIVYFHRRS